LADLRWERRPPSGADVLAVADRYQGRAITYRQAQFVYETMSGKGGHRNGKASFSSAAAARRYMISDLRAVFRARTGMPKIGSDQLAPHCSVEEGPTGLELGWPGGRATFRADNRRRQQPPTFERGGAGG